MKQTMFMLVALLAPVQGQTITPVQGASWLTHIHRSFDQTSMGKSTGIYGPKAPMPGDWPPRAQVTPGTNLAGQRTTMNGEDLYRLKCRPCHGLFGVGAAPEIHSVIDPVRATSARLYVERMRKLGVDIDVNNATALAKQARLTLFDRLHKGGTDMPPPDPRLRQLRRRS
jgi:hypothetical protein